MEQYLKELAAQWGKLSVNHKPDWMGYERLTVAILKDPTLTANEQVSLCREALDAFTGRGYFTQY